MVDTFADRNRLARMSDIGLAAASFVAVALGAWCWHWPLRVGMSAHAEATNWKDTMREDVGHRHRFRPIGEGNESFDVVVVTIDELPRITGLVGAAVVIGPASDEAMTTHVARGESFSPGALIAVPDTDAAWFTACLDELSLDRPLDVAVSLSRPDALIMGDPNFFSATALRNWMRWAAGSTLHRGNLQHSWDARALSYRSFNKRSAVADALRDVVLSAESVGEIYEIRGRPGTRAIRSPGTSDETAWDTKRAGVQTHRLVAQVQALDGSICHDGFFAGRVHEVSFRIAAKGGAGEVFADAPIESPTPGRITTLDVLVAVAGSRSRAQTTRLQYPADGDGPWSEPVRVRAPRSRSSTTLYVTVLWKGRVVQSATLTGSVKDADSTTVGPEMTLTVDVSSEVAGDTDRSGADATFVAVPTRGVHPMIFDTSTGIPIPQDRLITALNRIRDDLIETFMEPPGSLAEAAVPLARLAVQGALLREALLGGSSRQFDSAAWIHVTSFAFAQVPLELVYDHAMPDLDTDVAICWRALGGERSCATACPDRDRADRVCPFGFWGTSKIIERRQHSIGRADTTASGQRTVIVRIGGVVAVAPQANAEDALASDRIDQAVARFTGDKSSTLADGWTGLEDALATPRGLLCLVPHTIPAKREGDYLDVKLQLGSEIRRLIALNRRCINPDDREPGPVVLALGCDTASVHASFATFVSRLHSLGAEIVVSAISQIPGREVADFVERFMRHLADQLAEGDGRFGAALTATRRETLCNGDLLALALTATGDADVRIGTM